MSQQVGSQIILIAIIILVFYFFLIRPQVKRQRERAQLIASVKVGDKVLTVGGVIGKVQEVKDDLIMLDAGKNVILKMTKSAVAQKIEQQE